MAQLVWNMNTNASWLSVDPATGVLSGTPADNDVGSYWVYISVADTEDGFASHNFTLTVKKPAVTPPPPPPENKKPKISDGKLEPGTGDTETEFTFTVHYSDEDGDVPSTITLVIDDTPHEMTLKSGSASDGDYEYKTTLAEGTHKFYFEASDGEDDAEPTDDTPTDSVSALDTPDVTKVKPADKKEEDEGPNFLLYLIPIIVIIIIIAMLAMRRRKQPEETEDELEE